MGWSGINNGALLDLAQKEFNAFITGDRNLSMQQDMNKYEIAVVILHAPSTQLQHTLPLILKVLARLPALKLGQVLDVYP
jgi:hypothetical protein